MQTVTAAVSRVGAVGVVLLSGCAGFWGFKDLSSSDAAHPVDASCGLAGDSGPGGALQSAETFSATYSASPASVAINPSNGNMVAIGSFSGTLNFGCGGVLTATEGDASNTSSLFVVGFDRTGRCTWARGFDNGLSGNSVTFDASGAAVVGGMLAAGGTVDLGCGTLAAIGDTDAVLAAFGASGSCLWNKSFGAEGQTATINTVAADPSGDILIAGQATGVRFGGALLSGAYVAKFASKGVAYAWSTAFAVSSCDGSGGPTLAVDPSGNVFLAGGFAETIDFAATHGPKLATPGAGTADTTEAAYVAKLDSSGKFQWANEYGDGAGGNDAYITGVAADRCGNVFVTGNFAGTINLGTGTLAASESAGFLAKLDAEGVGVWSDPFVPSGPQFDMGSIAVDAADGPTITAYLGGDEFGAGTTTVDFGGGTLAPVPGGSVAVSSFDASGRYRWSYSGGPPSTGQSAAASGQAIAIGEGNIVLFGAFGTAPGSAATSPSGTTLVFHGTTLTAVSQLDPFLASFTP